MSQTAVIPVSVLVHQISDTLRQNLYLPGVWIAGEVGNLTKHYNGHYYFSLKDEHSELACVMWRGNVQRLAFSLESGMSVLVKGDVSLYEARGQLQFNVREIRLDGVGALYLQLEQLKQKLLKEGLFDLARKKPKPHGILDIGIVTAKDGAALQDVRTTIAKRWPMARLHLFPATVQGKQAPKTIVKALKAADKAGLDAVLLVRGGGSFEDLFCFNDESIVRTLADMKTFTVTGIGHEVDTSLADLAADHRAATPTAAAQYITPDQLDVFAWIESCRQNMIAAMEKRLDTAALQLTQIQSNPYLADPNSWVQKKKLELEGTITQLEQAKDRFVSVQHNHLAAVRLALISASPSVRIQTSSVLLQQTKARLEKSVQDYALSQRNRLAQTAGLLDAYSPLKVLARGYAMASVDGRLLTESIQAPVGSEVKIQLYRGSLLTRVEQQETE